MTLPPTPPPGSPQKIKTRRVLPPHPAQAPVAQQWASSAAVPPAQQPQQPRRSGFIIWVGITVGAVVAAMAASWCFYTYTNNKERERQAEENARLIAAIVDPIRTDMESRKQQMRERLEAKEEEIRRRADQAEEEAENNAREEEEKQRKANEELAAQKEKERLENERKTAEERLAREKEEQLAKERREKEAQENADEAHRLCVKAYEAITQGNDSEAAEYYQRASDLGSAEAAYNLGVRYILGRGVSTDLNRGVALYKLSAERGYAGGQLAYGKCLIEGRAVPVNVTEGKEWIQKAADQGMQEAKDYLGTVPSTGSSTPPLVGDTSDIQFLIDRLQATHCKHPESVVQQRFLLNMLPQIRDGANVNMTTSDSRGHTALHYACGLGSRDITRWLLNHGANANARADNGDTPLSCTRNNSDIKSLLLQHGAVAPTPPAPSYSGGSSYTSASEMLGIISRAYCRDSTDRMFQSKLQQIFNRISNGGAGVNVPLPGESNTALHYACGLNQPDVVEWLLNHGASPYSRNKHNQTPADCAHYNNSGIALDVLRRRGLDIIGNRVPPRRR